MRIGFTGLAVVVFCGLVAGASYAQQQPLPATAKAGAKIAHPKFVASVSQRGALGGPVNKGSNINGTGIKPKH